MRKRTPTHDDVKLSPSVSRPTWERLKALATQQNRSLNDLLNEWIEERVAKLAPKDEDRKGGTVYGRPRSHALALADRQR